jgi:hypothetical protein
MADINNDIKNILNNIGEDYVDILVSEIKRKHKIASMSLINSIKYSIVDGKVVVEANDYITYIDQGRKPGKYPNINAISKWARLKGIPQYAVFPIARKIKEKGVKPTHILSKSMTQFENLDLENKLADVAIKSIENTINEKINNKYD